MRYVIFLNLLTTIISTIHKFWLSYVLRNSISFGNNAAPSSYVVSYRFLIDSLLRLISNVHYLWVGSVLWIRPRYLKSRSTLRLLRQTRWPHSCSHAMPCMIFMDCRNGSPLYRNACEFLVLRAINSILVYIACRNSPRLVLNKTILFLPIWHIT